MKKHYEIQEFEDAEGWGCIAFCCSLNSLAEAEKEYAKLDSAKHRRLVEVDTEGMPIRFIRVEDGIYRR